MYITRQWKSLSGEKKSTAFFWLVYMRGKEGNGSGGPPLLCYRLYTALFCLPFLGWNSLSCRTRERYGIVDAVTATEWQSEIEGKKCLLCSRQLAAGKSKREPERTRQANNSVWQSSPLDSRRRITHSLAHCDWRPSVGSHVEHERR